MIVVKRTILLGRRINGHKTEFDYFSKFLIIEVHRETNLDVLLKIRTRA